MTQESHCWAYTLRKPELKESCVQVFDRTSSVPVIPQSRMGGPYGSISSVQLLSHVRLFATPWTAECQASLSHHQLPELAQTHVHQVSDAIQPSHPLLSPSPPAFNPSQHQGLFQWISSSHQVTKVLELQHLFFQWIFRTDFLRIDWFDLLEV